MRFRVKVGTPNRESQEYSRNILGMYLPGSLHSTIFPLFSWGSVLGFPAKSLQFKVEAAGIRQFKLHIAEG